MRMLLPFFSIMPALIYALITLYCGWRFFSKGPGTESPDLVTANSLALPGVTILKPVKGMDGESYSNFESFCRQSYAGNMQIVFAAASADDPAIGVIQRLISAHPDMDISLVVNPAIHGPNYKVSNLINAFPKARHDIIIVCDSDIRVRPDYLSSVTAHFRDPRVGLVTSLYRTSNVHGVATAIEATGFTAEMIPNVMVALRLEGLTFALGASMAVRRESLASIGGFEALADYLADDYQLGNKVHLAGWRIALDSCFVESIMKEESIISVLSRQLRWARTMRVSRPGGYLASGMTLPFMAVMLAAFTAPSIQLSLTAITLLYAVRLGVTTIYSRRLAGDQLMPVWLWLVPLRDMLGFFTWALAFLGNSVEWRGSRFRLKPGGKLEELA
ncbi:MAG TPA: bacteriohopanetetrol glucosamine biosynthesis glycosyltransferase HpnI [Deltaproteobacteria bacterium]|nr:bacteriohopanetetrol glucosamine biosynthesis glycosyltransferase HpnI [Deltaproteobacteria bacterium]